MYKLYNKYFWGGFTLFVMSTWLVVRTIIMVLRMAAICSIIQTPGVRAPYLVWLMSMYHGILKNWGEWPTYFAELIKTPSFQPRRWSRVVKDSSCADSVPLQNHPYAKMVLNLEYASRRPFSKSFSFLEATLKLWLWGCFQISASYTRSVQDKLN